LSESTTNDWSVIMVLRNHLLIMLTSQIANQVVTTVQWKTRNCNHTRTGFTNRLCGREV